jgi:hypothetical protein
VGNAVTDAQSDNRGIIEYYWSHALISDETYAGLVAACGGTAFGSDACREWFDRAYRELGNIDLHTIYTPVCLTPDPYQASDGNGNNVNINDNGNNVNINDNDNNVNINDNDDNVNINDNDKGNVNDNDDDDDNDPSRRKQHRRRAYDPCTPNYADAYFNRPDVQKAFHANTSGSLKGPWTICK